MEKSYLDSDYKARDDGMYQDYFGLTCKPFSMTPDPRFIYLSASHKEALAHLLYGIEHRSGFIELSGEIGAGKTTLVRTLLSRCDDRYRTAFIFNPRDSAPDLLRTISREFDLKSDGSRSDIFNTFNQFLIEQNAAGRTVLLVVDEAQNLNTAALEEIRLLSNLETETDKLVQIILVGQPDLRALLERSEIRQLNQRIAVRYHLEALDPDETSRYVLHRLRIAGAESEEIFSASALKKIYRWSGGVPRRINILCDRLLLLAYSDERGRVTGADVGRAGRELQHGRLSRPSAALRYIVPVVLLFAFVALTLFIPPLWKNMSSPIDSPVQADIVRIPSPPSAEKTDALREALAGMSETESLRSALMALSRAWTGNAWGYDVDSSAMTRRNLLHRFSLPMASFSGELSQLLRLDAPSLVELSLPGGAGSRFLAVVAREGGRIVVAPELAGEASIDIGQFERLWCGKALIPWRNSEQIPFLGTPGERGEGIAALQRELRACGLYGGAIHGIYDPPTIESVKQLQAQTGLVADGRVGPQTLMSLYRRSGSHRQPSLSAGLDGQEGLP